ncbi:MAG TPA: hypothetical protein VKV40_14195 [Ktedonobacteraceae bacterium]|nr:hypothetical protein [Ktedonobacteraceae bacterium]
MQASGAGHRASQASRRRPPRVTGQPHIQQASRRRPPRRPPARGGLLPLATRKRWPYSTRPLHRPGSQATASLPSRRRPPARGGPTLRGRSTSGKTASSIVGPPLAGGLGGLPVTLLGVALLYATVSPAQPCRYQNVYSRATPCGWPAPAGLLPLACDTRWPAPAGLRAAVAVLLTTIYLPLHQSPQHSQENAAIFVVGDIDRAVEAGNGGKGES